MCSLVFWGHKTQKSLCNQMFLKRKCIEYQNQFSFNLDCKDIVFRLYSRHNPNKIPNKSQCFCDHKLLTPFSSECE